MNATILFAGVAVVLFVVSFFTSRRIGRLGLALAAGSILSTIWAYEAELIMGAFGIIPPSLSIHAVTLAVITLLPMIILLFHGPRYKTLVSRIIGSLLITVLALAFLVGPLGQALVIDGSGADIYSWFVSHKDIVISAGLVLAVGDLLITKSSSHSTGKRSRR